MKPHTNYSPRDALERVLDTGTPLAVEEIPLTDALYRVLAHPLTARVEDPRFNKSAVDGIGITTDAPTSEFEIVGTIAAGNNETRAVAAGQAVRIMTGAPVPPEVVRVIKIENCTVEGSHVRVNVPEQSTNIAARGENIRAGDPLISPRRLLPADIGVLASQGYTTIPVHRKPRVAVIATGDEIYPAGAVLPPAGIYDSNSHQLTAFARDSFAEVTNFGVVGDERARITHVLGEAIATHDVIILSGGVSMGDLDFVPDALAELGAKTLFHGLAMKPGRPTLYAIVEGEVHMTRVFGLPGNPVSTAVQFEFLVRPLLWALGGTEYHPRETRLPLAERFSRTHADRYEFLPGILRNGVVERLPYTGSGHISVLAHTTLVFGIDRGIETVEPGSEVYVRFLR